MLRSKMRFFTLALIFAFGIGFSLKAETAPLNTPTTKQQAPQSSSSDITPDTFKQLTLFSDVLERTRADYVDSVTDEKLIESAINGMLSSLDPHSGYLNKKNFQEMQTQTKGEFGGLGVEITMDNGLIKIVSPIDDTPAAKAGLQPNDLITTIDAKPVMEMTLNDAVDKMRGAPGTKITLTVRRGGLNGRPFDITLTRAIIKIRSVKWEDKNNVGYIRITTFNEQTQPGIDKAIDELNKKLGPQLSGYVLDLRNNPGGLLDQAVSVAGTFLDSGKEIVSTRGRHEEENQSYVAKSGDKTGGKPVVVLINSGSASASEIVAGALQDYRRAMILGTKSFGKGSVQTIIPLPGAGAMRLTTARYYTPSGRSIQQLGIEPDITVQPAKVEEFNSQNIHESDLRGALQNDLVDTAKEEEKTKKAAKKDEKDGTPSEGAKTEEEKKPVDYQLERALDLINGLHLFTTAKVEMEKK